jgi:hypothetical protein
LSKDRIYDVSGCSAFPSRFFSENLVAWFKSLLSLIIVADRCIGSAGSNNPLQATDDSACLLVARESFSCHPRLSAGVRD